MQCLRAFSLARASFRQMKDDAWDDATFFGLSSKQRKRTNVAFYINLPGHQGQGSSLPQINVPKQILFFLVDGFSCWPNIEPLFSAIVSQSIKKTHLVGLFLQKQLIKTSAVDHLVKHVKPRATDFFFLMSNSNPRKKNKNCPLVAPIIQIFPQFFLRDSMLI